MVTWAEFHMQEWLLKEFLWHEMEQSQQMGSNMRFHCSGAVASSAAWQAQGWILRTGETFSTVFRYLRGITWDGENQAVPGTASTSLS